MFIVVLYKIIPMFAR